MVILGGVLQARDQQLPTYQNALDSLAFAVGTQVNQQNGLGIDANGNPGTALFSLPPTQSGAAGLIQVATTDPNAVAAALPGEGSAGNTNASALADLSSANIVGGQTASGFLASFLARLATILLRRSRITARKQATLTQLTTQRDSLSGGFSGRGGGKSDAVSTCVSIGGAGVQHCQLGDGKRSQPWRRDGCDLMAAMNYRRIPRLK